MQTGKRNHLVKLQTAAGNNDSIGERSTVWSDVKSVWASIEPLSINARFLAAQVQSTSTHKLTILYDSAIASINSTWRVKFGTRVFLIDGVLNTAEGNKELVLVCTEDKRTE